MKLYLARVGRRARHAIIVWIVAVAIFHGATHIFVKALGFFGQRLILGKGGFGDRHIRFAARKIIGHDTAVAIHLTRLIEFRNFRFQVVQSVQAPGAVGLIGSAGGNDDGNKS